MIEVLFDEKKVNHIAGHAYYKINFSIFFAKIDTTNLSKEDLLGVVKRKIKDNTNRSCFAEFINMYSNYVAQFKVRPNRLRYYCNTTAHEKKELHLSKKEIARWVALCRKNKLLPANIGRNFVKNGILDINISDISINLMYVYLCAARYIQDEPFFVRAMLHFHDDLGIGFFTSLAVATKTSVTNQGHHLFPSCREYSLSCNKKALNNENVEALKSYSLVFAVRLYNFLNGYDNSEKIGQSNMKNSYRLHAFLKNINLMTKLTDFLVERNDLTKKETEKLARTVLKRKEPKNED